MSWLWGWPKLAHFAAFNTQADAHLRAGAIAAAGRLSNGGGGGADADKLPFPSASDNHDDDGDEERNESATKALLSSAPLQRSGAASAPAPPTPLTADALAAEAAAAREKGDDAMAALRAQRKAEVEQHVESAIFIVAELDNSAVMARRDGIRAGLSFQGRLSTDEAVGTEAPILFLPRFNLGPGGDGAGGAASARPRDERRRCQGLNRRKPARLGGALAGARVERAFLGGPQLTNY